MKGVVRTTQHAYEMALERFPEDFPPTRSHEANCGRISTEVGDAVDAGRMSKRVPRWALKPESTKRHPGKDDRRGELRYIWTEDETRLYVIRRFPRRDHGRATVIVVTVIRPAHDELEAA